MMKLFSRMIAGSVLLVVAATQLAVANNEDAARDYAKQLADNAIAILEDANLSETGKKNELENLFSKSIDFDWVARFVLGKHWRAATEEQQQAYLSSYKEFIIKNFTGRIGEYSGQEYEIRQVRPDGEPGEYLLTLELKNGNEPPIFLDYRLREEGSSFKIFDIIIEGVSLITTQRSEFNSVVDRKGLDFLISALEKRSQG